VPQCPIAGDAIAFRPLPNYRPTLGDRGIGVNNSPTVDLVLVIELLGGRNDSSLWINREHVDGRLPAQRELVERRQFAVGRRHDADLDARRPVLLDVEDVDGQFEARSLVVHVDHVNCQRNFTYRRAWHRMTLTSLADNFLWSCCRHASCTCRAIKSSDHSVLEIS